jgi:hypothetical protein
MIEGVMGKVCGGVMVEKEEWDCFGLLVEDVVIWEWFGYDVEGDRCGNLCGYMYWDVRLEYCGRWVEIEFVGIVNEWMLFKRFEVI